MQFNRSSQRDDRRRRVLNDEASLDTSRTERIDTSAATASAMDGNPNNSPTPRYSEAARRERLPSVMDLVPRRGWVIVVSLLLALGVIAGLEALYAWMPALAHETTDGRIAAFDLDGEGSLSQWFSSATLALAAVMALLVYTVRRHRVDDYHGRYRVWLWAAACWTVMSIDEGGSLHEGFKELMVQVTGARLMGDGSIWWTGPYFVVLGFVGVRLLLDMRPCRGSRAALIGTAVCYVVGVVVQLGWLLPEAGARAVMFEEGAEMLGNVLLVLAMSLHGRFVILEAGGKLPERKRRPRSAPARADKATPSGNATAAPAASSATPTRPRRTDLEPAELHARAAARKVEDELEDQFDQQPVRRAGRRKHRVDPAEPENPDKLSKAQRKALRRQKERQRREGLR